MKKLLLSLTILFVGFNGFAQIKYKGKEHTVDNPVSLTGLQLAGNGFRDLGMKFPGSDTISNCKIVFTRSSIGQMKELKLTLIVRNSVMVQFQVNTNDPKQVLQLNDLSMRFYGKSKKSTTTKSVTMSSWENEKNGKLIQTFLIVSNNNKKAELVSWVSN